MKIMFAIKSMNSQGGGAERVLADVSSEFCKRGYDVSILTYDKEGEESFYPLHPDIERISLGIGRTDRQTSLPETLVRMYYASKAIKKHRPDAVIAFMHSMFIPLGLSLKFSDIPLIASEHIVPAHYETRPFQKALLALTPYLVSRITCVTEQVKQSYSEFLRRKMTVILNPTNTERTEKSDVLAFEEGKRTLLSVGRLEEQKNHATLIKAFAQISDDVPDWRLNIAGSGNLMAQIQALINDLNVGDKVNMLGNVREVEKEYLRSQLFVLASTYESFGLSVAEALSYGLPVIGMQSCQGINELIVPNENGLLVDDSEDAVADLAEKLKTLMQDDDLRLKLANASTSFLDRHNIKNVTDQWEALVKEIVS